MGSAQMPHRSSCSHYAMYIGIMSSIQPLKDALKKTESLGADFVITRVRHKDNGKFDDFVDISNVSNDQLNSSVVGIISYSRISAEGMNDGQQDIREKLSWANHGGMNAVL